MIQQDLYYLTVQYCEALDLRKMTSPAGNDPPEEMLGNPDVQTTSNNKAHEHLQKQFRYHG